MMMLFGERIIMYNSENWNIGKCRKEKEDGWKEKDNVVEREGADDVGDLGCGKVARTYLDKATVLNVDIGRLGWAGWGGGILDEVRKRSINESINLSQSINHRR